MRSDHLTLNFELGTGRTVPRVFFARLISRLLARVGLVTPEQRAWAWYDWANSAYFTTVITAVFPAFYGSYASAGLDPAQATPRFARNHDGIGRADCCRCAGAWRDCGLQRHQEKATAHLHADRCRVVCGDGRNRTRRLAARVDPFHRRQHRCVGQHGVLRFAAATRRARRRNRSRVVRGLCAWAISAAACSCWSTSRGFSNREVFGFADTVSATKAAFVSVAVWWVVFSIPLLRKVPEPPVVLEIGETREAGLLKAVFGRLGRTFRDIRHYKHAFLLFLAMLLYQDGIQTIIRMASIYGAEIGIDQTAQIAAFVMVQFLGIPFSFLFGALGARIGTKRALFIALAVYTADVDPRLFHDHRDALLHSRRPGRHGTGRQPGAQPGVFRAIDPGAQDFGVFWLLCGVRTLRDHPRAAGLHGECARSRARAAPPSCSSSCSSRPARSCSRE